MATSTNPYHDFLKKVFRMRRAQKDDLKYGSRATRSAREAAEREVDLWLESVGLQAAKVRQMALEPKPESPDV